MVRDVEALFMFLTVYIYLWKNACSRPCPYFWIGWIFFSCYCYWGLVHYVFVILISYQINLQECLVFCSFPCYKYFTSLVIPVYFMLFDAIEVRIVALIFQFGLFIVSVYKPSWFLLVNFVCCYFADFNSSNDFLCGLLNHFLHKG